MPQNQHILFALLKHLEVPFTERYLNELTEGMPHSDTLIGMSNILKEKYRLECACLRIEKSDIFKLDTPFIAQLTGPRRVNALVTNVEPDQVILLYKNETAFLSIEEFFTTWDGIVLLAAPNENTREEKYWKNLRLHLLDVLRIPLIVVTSVVLLLYLSRTNLNNVFISGWTSIALWVSYLFGLTLSALLISQSINKSDSFVEKVCRSGNKKGCSKLLDGDAAKLFGLISWSEVGVVYFIGSALVLLFFKENIGVLFIISIAAMPYTFWSLYYQWRIAKQWCPFCVSIQITLWAIFILHLVNFRAFSVPINAVNLTYTIACFLVPALVLWLVVPFAKSHYKLKAMMINYRSFKFSEPVFAAAMKISTSVDTSNASSIVFGNPHSKFTITLATSLYCGHCIEANRYLKEFLDKYRERVSVQIVFKVPSPPIEDNLAIKHMIGVHKSYDLATAEAIYHQMYESGINNIKKFIELYPVPEGVQNVDQEIAKHIDWFNKSEILATPTVFINQQQLPGWYDVSDLEHLFMMTNLT